MRPSVAPELISCGVAEVDAALGGGFPLGKIAELVGVESSGRTTLALSTLAEVTQRGESCAYVDASDSFDPVSAAALGVDLRRMLWVRAGSDAEVSTFTPAAPAVRSVMRSGVTESTAEKQIAQRDRMPGRGWCHPRSEVHGMDRAIGELFHGADEAHTDSRSKSSGTLPDFTPRCSEMIRRSRPEAVIFRPQPEPARVQNSRAQRRPKKAWSRLEQSLRATDLLLNTGGFGAIVLDMGEIDPEQARRVPLATWYRFRLQVEKLQTLFLLLTRVTCAHGCAAVSLQCEGAKAEWQRAADESPALLTGLHYCANVTRGATRSVYRNPNPYGKKPAASAQAFWSSATLWSR
jgi:hypothetical protein